MEKVGICSKENWMNMQIVGANTARIFLFIVIISSSINLTVYKSGVFAEHIGNLSIVLGHKSFIAMALLMASTVGVWICDGGEANIT